MNELENTIALLFKKKGKSALTEKEFVFSASMDYRWFKPKEAQKLLDLGLETELLESNVGLLKPTFDYKTVEIPKNFQPTIEILKTPLAPKGTFLQIVDLVSTQKKIARQEVIAMVNKRQEKMRLNVEVAALITAYELGLDISGLINKVEAEIVENHK